MFAATTALTSAVTTAGCGATNRYGHLLANDTRLAACHRIRNASGDAFLDLNRSRRLHRRAHGIRHSFHTRLGNVVAHTIRYLLGATLFFHVAYPVSARFGAGLRDHVADAIRTGPGAGLRNHVTDAVGARLGAGLRNHATNSIRARLRTRLRNHLADAIVAHLRAGFWNHTADPVGARLGTRFRNHPTNSVRDLLGNDVALVTNTFNRFLSDLGHPDLAAYGARWTLHLDHPAFARTIYTPAATGVPCPTAWILHAFADHRTRTLADMRIPMPTADIVCLGIVDRRADRPAHRTMTRFVYRLANRIADVPSLGFPDRIADRIANRPRMRFPMRPAHGVTYIARLGFPDGLAHCVTNVAGLCLPNRLTNCVTCLSGLRFPTGLADRVTDIPLTGLPNWLANCVVASAVASFEYRLTYRVRTVAIVRFPSLMGARNRSRLTNRIVHGLIAGVLLLVVHHFAAGFHDRVTMLLCLGITIVTATRGTESVACGAAQRCTRLLHRYHGDSDRQYGYVAEKSHLPFSWSDNSVHW